MVVEMISFVGFKVSLVLLLGLVCENQKGWEDNSREENKSGEEGVDGEAGRHPRLKGAIGGGKEVNSTEIEAVWQGESRRSIRCVGPDQS